MEQSVRKRIGLVLAALAFAGNYAPWLRDALRMPDSLTLASGQTHVVQTGLPMRVQTRGGTAAVIASADERLCEVAVEAVQGGETSVTFSLFGVPVHETKVNVVEERVLIPGGQAVGVALKTRGVLVVSGAGGRGAALRAGDVILAAAGQPVVSARELSACIARADRERVVLQVLRGGKTVEVQAATPVDATDGKRRLGVWVRDSTAGVGTLSYIDPQTGAYGALGHAIVDADTGSLLDAREGAILRARVIGVTRGQSGKAGELQGSFLKEGEQIGSLALNSAYGIYGVMEKPMEGLLYPQGLPVGARDAVHPGPATILATVDEGGAKEYTVEIVRCFAQDAPSAKGMVLRVTDERLLARTGGIVQGMSGSPILQDGRIVGAVTHVVLSDAAQGYGMYIEWMLAQSDALSGGQADEAA